jgi:hypothetical protein
MRTLNNSILINNNLKSGKTDSTLKTIELLAKLGLLPKKKKPTKKIIGYDETGEPIRQNNKMVASVSYGPPSDKGPGGPPNLRKSGAPGLGYTGTSTPAITYIDRSKPPTTEEINKQQTQLKQQAEKLQDGGTPEEIQQFNLKLAQFNDLLQKRDQEFAKFSDTVGENLKSAKQYVNERLYNMSLGNIESQRFRPDEPVYSVEANDEEEEPIKYEFSQNAQPFPKASEETTYMETDEQDFTNQGSQDIPQDVLNVDVSPSPNEIVEDEEQEAFPSQTEAQVKPDEEPQASAQAEPEVKAIPDIPTNVELSDVNFFENQIPEFTQDIFRQFGFAYPEIYVKGRRTKIDKLRTIADNFSQTFNIDPEIDGEEIDIKTANGPTLEAFLKNEIIGLGFKFRDQYKPKYNKELEAWRFTQKKAKKSKK